MGAPSNTFITSTLNTIKNGTPYLALYTTNPTSADTGTEVPTYSRKAITFTAPNVVNGKGTISNSADIIFTDLPNSKITHYAVRSALTNGNMYVYGTLTSVTVIVSGDQLTIPAGGLIISFGA